MENAPNKKSECVLIVDDDESSLEYLSLIVAEAGYRVIPCSCGKDAVNLAKTGAPDIVLLDIVLPDMMGYEVAAVLRAEFAPEQFVPIIFVSCLSQEKDKVEGLLHADDYVTKPFSDAELLSRIKSWLRHRSMHAELALSRRRYKSLYDDVPQMYVSLDAHYVITDCNCAFSSSVKMEKSEITGLPLTHFFEPSRAVPLRNHLQEILAFSFRTPEAVFAFWSGPQQFERMVLLTAALRQTSESSAPAVVALQDITARVRLEEEQKLARMQLYRSARLASIGTLASGVAHEINNPLTAILGFASALLNRVESNETIAHEELHEYLGVIASETIRCRDIIENLSNFARDRETSVRPVLLSDSVNAAVKLTGSRVLKRGGSIENKVDTGLMVMADAGRLGQVLVNLISNAIDFSQDAPRILLSSKTLDHRRRRATLSVRDSGLGIDPQVLPKVFDPFFTTKEVGKGTGLGLALCHTIMEECNGNIDIFSEPGKGTEVVLELELAGEEVTEDLSGQGAGL